MGLESDGRGSESRFAAYVEALTAALGHADRAAPFRAYCIGLLLPGPRKSVEPMAARIEPARVQAAHQSLHHLVAKADGSDEAVLTRGPAPSDAQQDVSYLCPLALEGQRRRQTASDQPARCGMTSCPIAHRKADISRAIATVTTVWRLPLASSRR